MAQSNFRGVLVPVLTPFKQDLKPNTDAFLTHCRWLLKQGADGLAVFGTTSEGNSLAAEERVNLLETLVEGGIPPAMLMPGTGTCALTETVHLTTHAVSKGCAGVLMLPPFYYKAVDDDALFASYSEVIQQVGNSDLRIYLYHIPPIAQVSISLNLIGRLLKCYPDVVVGLKDSSGDWNHTEAVLQEYPSLATFCGSEVFLLDTLRHGGAGSITATANVNTGDICSVFENWKKPDAEEHQAQITAIRRIFEGYAPIPALKAVVAAFYDSPEWQTTRPPLNTLSGKEIKSLMASLGKLGFGMANK
ncbi:MAG: dihydrodipicolinate synthase family protein [Gammaproteobacteria bacterium]